MSTYVSVAGLQLTHVPEHRYDNEQCTAAKNWSFEKGVARFVPQAATK